MVKKNVRSCLKLLAVTGLAIYLVHISSAEASNSSSYYEVTAAE